jgi:hypothetical protein
MHRFITSLMALAIGVGVMASSAHAQFNVPFKGKQFKGNLMVGYAACTAPDTVTDDAHPACTTVVRTDTGCGYGGGQGKIQIKGQTVGNYDARLKLTSLDAACEGQTLNFFANVRRTGRFCGGNVCTVTDSTHQFGSCVVLHNVCKFGGQFTFPGGPGTGETELLDVFVNHGANRAFTIGLVHNP